MQRRYPSTLAAAVSLLLGFSSPMAGAEEPVSLTLVSDGAPAATIVLAQEPTKAAQFAAYELQYHVKLITGAQLPIAAEGAEIDGIKLVVGDSNTARVLGCKSAGLAPQEYLIRFLPDAILLLGTDKKDFTKVVYNPDDLPACRNLPGFWEEQATAHAVYDFLEQSCGVRWFDHTDAGTSHPLTSTLEVKGTEVKRAPFFRYRDALGAIGDSVDRYASYVALWPAASPEFKEYETLAFADLQARYPEPDRFAAARSVAQRLFLLRMRNGGDISRCNHSLYGYYDRFWEKSKDPDRAKLFVEKRPEMFAQGYESQPPQMCYSSDALVKQLAQDARDYYDGKATGGGQGIFWNPQLPNLFPVEPMDNSSFCKCTRCQAWLSAEQSPRNVYSTGTYSDYFFQFVNAVVKELNTTHPNKQIVTLAYASHAVLPTKFKLDPNVAVQFCFAANRSPFARDQYENEVKLLKDWAAEGQGKRPLYLWLYDTFPKEIADNGKFHCFPGFFAHTIGEQFRLFRECGVRGMFHCGYGQEVEAYLTFKLMDDPTLSVDTLLDDYFTRLYGPAADAMKELYLGIEKVYCDPANYTKTGLSGMESAWGVLGTAERMAGYAKLIGKARKLAATAVEKRRVELFVKGTWSYMLAGRNQYLARTLSPVPSVAVPRVAAAAGDLTKVQWDGAAVLGGTWFDRGQDKPAARRLSGRVAHDGEFLYLELTDPCDPTKLVTSAMVFPYDDWELFVAKQRAQPYRQYAVSPSGNIVALSHGEVNWRMNVPLEGHGAKATSDVSAPDRWVTRLALPLKSLVVDGAQPGGKLYLNVMRITCPQIAGDGRLGLDTWVSYCTVHEVDRLGELTLAP